MCACVYHIAFFFIHSSLNKYLGIFFFFHFLTIVNNIAMYLGVQTSLWHPPLQSFEYAPGSGMAWPCGSYVFKSFINCPTVVHVAVPFHIPPHRLGFKLSPCWRPFSGFAIVSVVMGVGGVSPGFWFAFPSDLWCGASLQVLFGHLWIFFGEVLSGHFLIPASSGV